MTNSIAIVTDECVDYAITTTLRNAGFEVYAISEQNPAIKDKDVLAIAFAQQALLITEDKDFGELVIRLQLPNNGILLVKMMEAHSQIKAVLVLQIIQQYNTTLLKAFSVLDANKFRTRSTT